MSACQVVLEKLYGCYNSQQFFIRGAIPPLARVEHFGGICNHPFDDTEALLLLLLQYSTNSCITGIRRQDEVSVSSWICQNGWLYQSFLKSLEGWSQSLIWFLCQARLGRGHGSKVRDVTAVIWCQSQEDTNVLDSAKSRPSLHSSSFHGFHFYPFSGHIMP